MERQNVSSLSLAAAVVVAYYFLSVLFLLLVAFLERGQEEISSMSSIRRFLVVGVRIVVESKPTEE